MATLVNVYSAAIRQFLRDRKRSLRWLAHEIPCDPGHLARMVAGGRPMPPDTFYRVAFLLQVDPEAIGQVEVRREVS